MIRLFSLTICLAMFAVAGTHAQSSSVDLTGRWSMALEMSMGMAEPMLEIKQGDAGKIAGTYTGRYGIFAITGTIKARHIEFSFTMTPNGEPVEMKFAGEVSADGQSMKGTAAMADLGDAEWSASRVRETKK